MADRAYHFRSSRGASEVAKLASDAAKRRLRPDQTSDPGASSRESLIAAARAGDTRALARVLELYDVPGLPPTVDALYSRRWRARARAAREAQRDAERAVAERAVVDAEREAAERREFAKWWAPQTKTNAV